MGEGYAGHLRSIPPCYGGSPSLLIDRKSPLLPGVEPSIERVDVLPTPVQQFLRRTGARCLVRSSTIGYDRPVLWNLRNVRVHFIGWDTNGARQFRRGFAPRLRVASVDESERLAPRHALF